MSEAITNPLVTDPSGSDLRPAARRRSKVDHGHARPDDFVFFLDFQQLVGGARAVAVLLRSLDIGVFEMLFQPGSLLLLLRFRLLMRTATMRET
jgi:hypothetical protein